MTLTGRLCPKLWHTSTRPSLHPPPSKTAPRKHSAQPRFFYLRYWKHDHCGTISHCPTAIQSLFHDPTSATESIVYDCAHRQRSPVLGVYPYGWPPDLQPQCKLPNAYCSSSSHNVCHGICSFGRTHGLPTLPHHPPTSSDRLTNTAGHVYPASRLPSPFANLNTWSVTEY